MPHLENMEWDFKDQMQHVEKGNEQVYYVYDAGGQRVHKVVEKNNGTLIEERIYLGGFEIFHRHDVSGLMLERETLHIMDDKQRIALVETRTIDTENSDGAPRQLMRYQLGNHLGSVVIELDENAHRISFEEYYPYGSTSYQAVRKDIEVPLKCYRYTGKERDEETGLYYHGARYYAPWIGRWISPEPLCIRHGSHAKETSANRTRRVPGQEAGEATDTSSRGAGNVAQASPLDLEVSVNSLYTYVSGNPVTRTDPTGYWGESVHNEVNRGVFRRLDPRWIRAINAGSAFVDQPASLVTPGTGPQHSMLEPGMTHEQGIKSREEFMAFKAAEAKKYFDLARAASEIAKEKPNATQFTLNGQIYLMKPNELQETAMWQGYYNVGQLVHPSQDESSPLHRWKTWHSTRELVGALLVRALVLPLCWPLSIYAASRYEPFRHGESLGQEFGKEDLPDATSSQLQETDIATIETVGKYMAGYEEYLPIVTPNRRTIEKAQNIPHSDIEILERVTGTKTTWSMGFY